MKKALSIFGALYALTLIACLSGCQNNPVTTAKTVEQKSYALYGTFVIFEEQAARLVQNPATPPTVIEAIKIADRNAKPVADSLLSATQQYLTIKGQLDAGVDSNAKLAIATTNLEQWVASATPVINDLVKAVTEH